VKYSIFKMEISNFNYYADYDSCKNETLQYIHIYIIFINNFEGKLCHFSSFLNL
jgi:hypothetical protein